MKSIAFSCVAAALFATGALVADEPLHQRIDQLVAADADLPRAAVTTDEAFLRRIYLDLAGRIPSAKEAREFLADNEADKRQRLIDQLLGSDEYARRMSEAFHVMLMERMGDHEEWRSFLRDSFAANKPWDQMTREILSPNADDEATRGAAFFYTKRLEKYGQNPVDYPGLVRDVGRLFLGVDVQCAQCHDHLFVNDYKQVDYQGLFAFVGQTFIRTDVKFPAVGEKLVTKKVDFKSVFVMEDESTGPRLPFGVEFEIPTFEKGEEYDVPPDRKTRQPGVPKFSPLRLLGDKLPSSDTVEFRRNIANRLWWVMMGRGLVDPLDLAHSDNPPSHPELLDLLAEELASHNFDIKWLVRELALSQTYQRSSLLPEGENEPSQASYAAALERQLSSEQLMYSMLQATGAAEPLHVPSPRADEGEGEGDEESGDDESSTGLVELQATFDKAFANPPREPEIGHSPTVKAALFVLNSETVLDLLKPADGNLASRLCDMDDHDALTDELYVAVLTRVPTDDERQAVADYLGESTDKPAAITNLIWSLLASTEFRLNH